VFIVAVAIVAIVAIITKYNNFNLYYGRVVSTVGNPNSLAAVLCLGILMITPKIIMKNLQINKREIGFLSISLFALFLTGSFSNFALLLTAIVLQFAIIGKFKLIDLSMVFFYTCLFLSLFSFLFYLGELDSTVNRFYDIFVEANGTSVVGRINQYQELFAFDSAIELLFGKFGYYSTHDGMYIQLIQNNGLIGLVLYVALMFYIIRKLYFLFKYLIINQKYKKNITCFLLGFLTFSLSELLLGFFATAIFYRFPLNAIFFLFSGLMFIEYIKIKRLALIQSGAHLQSS